MDPAPVTMREYRPGDEEAILEAFNRVFAAIDPTFRPRTMETWRWLNLENPSGLRIRVAATEDGRIAAHVSGVAQRVLLQGGPGHVNQSVDGFADPAWRRALRRPGIYARLLRSFNEFYAGPPPDGDAFVWGLPVVDAWRIGRAFCGEHIVRTQNKLVGAPAGLYTPGAAGVDVEEVEHFPEEVEGLFRRRAEAHGVIAVRDAPQLEWRFTRNPQHDYAIALVRTGGRLAGYAVYRRGAYDGQEHGLVCDWLVEPGRRDVGDALRAWCASRARAEGLERVTAVFPDTVEEWVDFQRAGFRVRPTTYFPAVYLYGKALSPAWLHREWYYTLGDSDLC